MGSNPPKTQFWGYEKAFFCKILKLAYYQNYRIDSNQILHSDKDHQMLVGGPDTCIRNPRWQMTGILEKSKSRQVLAIV